MINAEMVFKYIILDYRFVSLKFNDEKGKTYIIDYLENINNGIGYEVVLNVSDEEQWCEPDVNNEEYLSSSITFYNSELFKYLNSYESF